MRQPSMFRRRPRRLAASHPLLPALLAAALVVAGSGHPALASFHFMQIEQAIGGVCGDVGDQAIQLRMRTSGQNFVDGTSLVAYDANGANPVTLVTFSSNVAGAGTGARILAATAGFPFAGASPTPDFLLANPIPAAYLPAGKITFEDAIGTVYWALAWGGAAYTGTNTGSTTNDADGQFNPPFAGVLAWTTAQAVVFPGLETAPSTNNAADYAFTSGAATFVDNDNTAGPVAACIFGDGFETGSEEAWVPSP